MKYIIACLLGLGFISVANAQNEKLIRKSSPTTCYMSDAKSPGCIVEKDVKNGNVQKGNSDKQENNLNPDGENGANINGAGSGSVKNAEDKYSEPEKESDTGILDYSQSYEDKTVYDKWKDVRGSGNSKEAKETEEVAKNVSPSVRDSSSTRR